MIAIVLPQKNDCNTSISSYSNFVPIPYSNNCWNGIHISLDNPITIAIDIVLDRALCFFKNGCRFFTDEIILPKKKKDDIATKKKNIVK